MCKSAWGCRKHSMMHVGLVCKRANMPPHPVYFTLGNGQNTQSNFHLEEPLGRRALLQQTRNLASLPVLADHCPGLGGYPIFTLYPVIPQAHIHPEGDGSHSQKRGVEWRKIKPRNWFSALVLASWGTQRICIWIRGNVAFFFKEFNLVCLWNPNIYP